jgi:hypothetical protein
MEQQRIENERKQKEQEETMKTRRDELEKRDKKRTQYMDQ